MLLRFVVFCGCAFALAGCHTIDAVHRIARPSPVTAVSVEPSQDRVAWLAEYREPPGGLDPILHRIFVRGVTKRGHLNLDPDSTCVASVEGDGTSAEPLRARESLLASHSYVLAGDVSKPPTSRACENQLRLRLSGTARYPEAKAIIVQNPSAEPLFEAVFPTERPALDPKRWGWLLVAPALDAGTIAIGIPIGGIVGVMEGIVIGLLAGSGLLQPTEIGLPVLVLTTTTGDGTSKDRVLARMESHGQLFVSANHWPRAWYHRALANPKVQVTMDGEKADYLAVPATEEEIDRIDDFPIVMRVLAGFPPRGFLRLDPR
ncbi:MAG: nitroreductase family deazaflavin-dependent oxidoreductase [Myxococcales bacterium]|nr:nitroreductase family deazaflavin-dependent oxidoreductase [Myxococcales bacterium]